MLSWKGFQKAFEYINLIEQGMVCTLSLSALTVLFGCILALFLAICRLSNFKPAKYLATVYVEVIRATPMLVQLFIVYNILLAGVSLPRFKLFGFIRFERFLPGVIALSLNSGAYLCEIIRSGIQSIDLGQTEAARSLGMTQWQNMQLIVLPQAIKNILPALCNEFISTVKGTSLASVFFVGELMTSYKTVQSATFLALQSLTIAGLIYFLLNYALSRLLKVIERRLTVSD